jgi:hypothetical protein
MSLLLPSSTLTASSAPRLPTPPESPSSHGRRRICPGDSKPVLADTGGACVLRGHERRSTTIRVSLTDDIERHSTPMRTDPHCRPKSPFGIR